MKDGGFLKPRLRCLFGGYPEFFFFFHPQSVFISLDLISHLLSRGRVVKHDTCVRLSSLWYTSTTNLSLLRSSSPESLPSQADESDLEAPAIATMPNPPSARKASKLGQSMQRRTATATAPTDHAAAV